MPNGHSLSSGDVDHGDWDAEIAYFVAWLIAGGAALGTARIRKHWLRALAEFTGTLSPWMLTLDDLTAFLSSGAWKPETRKSARSSIRTFYSWAVRTGRTAQDPSYHLRGVTVPLPDPKPASETAVEHALRSAAGGRRRRAESLGGGDDRLMLMLALYAGLRRGEIARLHTDHVSEDMVRFPGKGGRWRTVPLHPVLRNELAGLPPGFVFPGGDDGHISANWVGKLLARHLGPGYSGHALRHRFATNLHAAGHDILVIQKLLGHAKVSTTQIYVKVKDDRLRRAVLDVGPGLRAVSNL